MKRTEGCNTNIVNTKVRDSNVELLRIICMLLLIMHHCSVHGEAYNMDLCTNKYIALFLLPMGKIFFDCFLAISMWFLVDQKFKTQKFVKLWLIVLFYNITFTGISALFGVNITIGNWIGTFFPITGNSHGFAASYLLFYLLLPFLTKLTANLNKFQCRWLLAILFYAEVVSQIISKITSYSQPIISELLLFVLFYVIALNLKKYPIKLMKKNTILFLIVIGIWIMLSIMYCLLIIKGSTNSIIGFLCTIAGDESSIYSIIGGFSLFFLGKNIKIPKIALVNKIATTTFGILLIHDHNFFRSVLWKIIVRVQDWYYSKYFIVFVFLAAVIIFTLGMLIDFLRQLLLEKPIFKSKKLQRFFNNMDSKLEMEDCPN